MNEMATEKMNFRYPEENVREIITKAVCGTARKTLRYTHYISPPPDVVPSQVLGCSVTEMRLNEPEVKERNINAITIGAGGTFEVHIWYAYKNGKETDVLRYPINFQEFLPVEDFECQNAGTIDAKITISKCPVVVESAITEDNQIKLETELEISAEVIGETKILVQVYVPGCSNDEDED